LQDSKQAQPGTWQCSLQDNNQQLFACITWHLAMQLAGQQAGAARDLAAQLPANSHAQTCKQPGDAARWNAWQLVAPDFTTAKEQAMDAVPGS
jgi:hypothetical protein